MSAVDIASITKHSSGLPPDALCVECNKLFWEVCSFYRAVSEQFGSVEAEKAVEDWFELLKEVTGDQRDAALVARRATIYASDRLASRIRAETHW